MAGGDTHLGFVPPEQAQVRPFTWMCTPALALRRILIGTALDSGREAACRLPVTRNPLTDRLGPPPIWWVLADSSYGSSGRSFCTLVRVAPSYEDMSDVTLDKNRYYT